MTMKQAVIRNDIAWSAMRVATELRHAWRMSDYGAATDSYRAFLRRSMRYYAKEAVQHARKELARKGAA